MWNVHPQFVTDCQRRLAAKFQFVCFIGGIIKKLPRKTRGSFFMVTRTGIDKIKERPPSSRRAASAHRALAFDRFDSLRIKHEKSSPAFAGELFSW